MGKTILFSIVFIVTISMVLPVLSAGGAGATQAGGLPPALPGSSCLAAPPNEIGRPAGSLTTIFAYDDGWAGNMFDIIPAFDTSITAIDINTKALNSSADVVVWYRDGTCVGHENSSAGWNLIGAFSGIGAGYNQPTFIDMSGNGVTFDAGKTYGIYVDCTSYSTTGTFLYTQGGPKTYKNADLTLITHCGKGPGFGGQTFIPRIWNGTVYYDDAGPLPPRVDIKCNGGDGGVVVPTGTNARIDFTVTAGAGAGVSVDVWIVLKTPFGFFSYDVIGPYFGWNFGLGNAFYTGPLADITGTALDRSLPAGSYLTGIGIDTVPNGSLDMANIYTMDTVDFQVK